MQGGRGDAGMRNRRLPAAGLFSSRRRDLGFLAAMILIGLAVALVDTLSVVHDRARDGRPIPFWEPFVWEMTSVAVLAALTPVVQIVVRRFPPLCAPWIRVIPAHLAAALVFSLIHVAAMGVLRWAIYAALGSSYAPFGPLSEFPYELRKDLLTYAVIATAYAAWLRLAPEAPARAEHTAAIEVRDGARRHFVPLDEVAWIEAAGNYVELHRGATPILHRAPLSGLERQLQTAGFVRIHRSRLVRRAAVAEVESKPSGDYVVRLLDGRELAGSRRYRKPLLEL